MDFWTATTRLGSLAALLILGMEIYDKVVAKKNSTNGTNGTAQ